MLRAALLLSVFAVLGSSASALAAGPRFIQLGGKLPVSGAKVGQSVAVSADGSTAIVGEPVAGTATVLTRSGSGWVEQARITAGVVRGGRSGDEFGWSVALSGNGNVALVGAPGDLEEEGAAHVFERSGSTWKEIGKEIPGECVWCSTGAEGGERESGEIRFGQSVALSADGSTGVIGAPGQEETTGAAQIVSIGHGGIDGTTEVVPNDEGGNATAQFGSSVAISGDGRTILAGGPEDGGKEAPGAAWVFTLSGSTWSQDGSKLTGAGESGEGGFGESVALSQDGQTALVGGGFDNGSAGAAWVFARSGESWTADGGKITPSGESGAGSFGSSVALSGDGATALIGGYADNGSAGAAWTFDREGEAWAQRGAKITPAGASGAARFGWSVALDEAGTLALIGSPHEPASGAVRAFAAATVPVVVTEGAAEVSKTGATITGAVDPNGQEVSSCRFEYGTTSAYGSSTPCGTEPGSGEEPVAVSAPLSGLEPGTTYHYRVTAINASGENVGEDATVYTEPEPPVAVTGEATNATSSTATLHASVNPNGATVTSCVFEYGGSPGSLGSSAACSPSPGSGHGAVPVAAFVSGLAEHSTVYFRVRATSAGGTGTGTVASFETHGGAPEFGVCSSVPAGTGAYTNGTCEKPGGKKLFVWNDAVAGVKFTTSESFFNTTSEGTVIACKGTSAGEFTSAQTIGHIVLKLTGCSVNVDEHKCESAGAATGEIVSDELEGVLGVVKAAAKPSADKLGIELFGAGGSGPIATFSCEGGAHSFAIRGAVIAAITANQQSTVQNLTFEWKKKTGQKLQSFVGGQPASLEISRDGGPFAKALLNSQMTIQSEQAIDANTVV